MQEIEFTDRRNGSATIMVDAGESIKIEANGYDLLDVEVPAGKI